MRLIIFVARRRKIVVSAATNIYLRTENIHITDSLPTQMLRQFPIAVLIGLIQDQVDKVESAQQGGRQLDVLHHRQLGVVAGLHGISGCQDGGARVQCRDDACVC